MAMCSSWAHLWALSRLLGPVTSLGSSLNNRHSPRASCQLGKAPRPWPGWSLLEKAGEGWTRLGKASGPEQVWTGWYNTLTHTEHSGTFLCWLTPESAVLNILSFAHFLTHLLVLAVLAVLATSGPTLASKMSQGLLGLCCLIETRGHIEIITLTAVLFE